MDNNNNNSRSNGSSGGPVKTRRQDGTADTDRLSHLPETHYSSHPFISRHQSRRSDLCVVPECGGSRGSTSQHSIFVVIPLSSIRASKRYVEKVLSLRHPFNVRKMTCIDFAIERPLARDRERYISPLVRMIKYALCHNTQHLDITMGYLHTYRGKCYGFSELFGTILDWNLESLELCCVAIDRGFLSSDFRLLTTL
ncbi:unnamed protein product [Linum tenue]|uniref:Uncharacterized protein n=1 Tax=Linum tenue TaxID=586396 RepID=A0AAV0M363_9ROSI|nr:unnamed protein product [Linum tenue]